MNVQNIKSYLKEKITNSWYRDAEIDYGISGGFLDAEAVNHDLKVVWEEDGERLEMVIDWYTEYTPEQLYNIWMEAA